MLAGLLTFALTFGPAPAPAPIHYRVEVKTSQQVDLTAVGSQVQTTDLSLIGFLSMTLADTTGGQMAHIVVDSLTLPAGATLPDQIAITPASAAGIFYHVYVVQGKIRGTPTPSRTNALAAVFTGAVDNLFPGVRVGAKLGDVWTDTTNSTPVEEGLSRNTVTVTSWKVTGAAGAVFTIEGTSSGTTQGQVTSGAGPLDLKGAMTGTRKLTATIGGPATGGTIQANQTATLSSSSLPAEIPVKGTTIVTITTLP